MAGPIPTGRPQPEGQTTIVNGKHLPVLSGAGLISSRTLYNYPDHSILRVYTETPSSDILLSARFGEGTINTTGGGGGVVSIARPQKKPITVWRGPQANYQHEIPLIFDTWGTTLDSIETEVGWLEQVAGVDMFTNTQPPLLILNAGGALPHDVFHSPQLRWVIPEEPVWGEAIRRRDSGERVRQIVTVKFMVWNAADIVSRDTPQSKTKSTYTAKQGDTYSKIAARALKNEGGAKWGNRLAQLNGARDGASSPKVGQDVKIPTADEVKKWSQTPRR